MLYICIATKFNNNKNHLIMSFLEMLPNYEDYFIVRLDVFKNGIKNGDSIPTGFALILEDEHGKVCIAEFIELEEFCEYLPLSDYDSFLTILEQNSVPSAEKIVEFSVEDDEIINHFEQFRRSKFNFSSILKEI